MTGHNKWRQVGALLDIPEDVTTDVSRVTILGREELLVENHGGIIEYTGDLLRLRIVEGELCIRGKELMLGTIEAEQVRVTGRIVAVQYV